MNEVLKRTRFRSTAIPNSSGIKENEISELTCLLPDVVENAKTYLHGYYQQYEERMNPLLDEELEKLVELAGKHKAYQLSLFESERKRSEQERRVDALFDKFSEWVTDTLTIQNVPYIRIIAVLKGVQG